MSVTNFPNGVSSFGAVLTGGGGPATHSPFGNTYYVATSANVAYSYIIERFGVSQNNDGSRVLHATLASALAACVDWRGDTIVLGRETHSVDETAAFSVKGLKVIGAQMLEGPFQGEIATIAASASFLDGPAATITQPTVFYGVGFAGRDTTKENCLVDCGEAGGFNGGFTSFINCRFPTWYGAMDAGLRFVGGAVNRVIECSWDGLFGGYGTGGIILENDTGAITPAYIEVLGCRFYEMGSGIHAIVHALGSTPLGVNYSHNYLLPGFGGNQGLFLDNNSVASTGIAGGNYLAPLAAKANAFSNMSNSTIGHTDNHYEEA